MVCFVEWSEDDRVLQFRGKIYVFRNSDLQRWIVSLCHNTKIAGHPGRWKTLELVSKNYWWPQMSRYIKQYISTYDLCLRTKPIRQAPIGELHPLWIPDSWWDMLSVDFVVELPLSSKHNAVMTVVDSVLKRAYFIPTLMRITRFDHKTKVKARSERWYLQTASQLCTKQVGTGEINQIIESLLKVKVQRITKTY